jgi:N-acetylmuramoyl-L-alanine amidase
LKLHPTRRIAKLAVTGLLLTAVLFSISALARTPAQKKQLAREQFDAAEQMRQELDSTPPSQRTKRDYQRVTDAYRRVYYVAPTYARADECVVNVGDQLAETGRLFKDQKLLQAAIGQYEFLRREYPGSKFRVDALFAIGQIYRDDLNDSAKAKTTFQDFLKHYPHSHLADDAHRALDELDQPLSSRKGVKKQATLSVRDAVLGPDTTPSPVGVSGPPKPLKQVALSEAPKDEEPAASSVPASEDKQQKSEHRSTLPLVTGIRHWSTPDYTRVAIDLESEVQYEAGRIANPDRIFFDLHDTKLASGLMGKTFEVEDGFLRKIRVAQYQRGLTRVVLDVDNISDYSAFLLPNPYRLIIDIHGKKTPRAVAGTSVPQPKPAITAPVQESAKDSKSATFAPTVTSAKNEVSRPVKEIPKAETTKAAGTKVELTKPAEQTAPDTTRKVASEVRVPESKDRKTEENKSEDAGTTIGKSSQPELKATPRPTSAPTFESVAPRDEILPKASRRKRQPDPELAREARPTASGERSLTRALGLKIGRIVIDAGHGGHDTGTIGPNGLQEKDLVLDVALRLGKLLESRMGAEVVYTRSDDTFIPLETRTAIANQQQADLFISIHANSSRDPSARGVETYYLNFTSSPDALEVAARENAVSEKSIHELQDLVKKITLRDKIDESREFAADVQRSLYAGVAAKTPAVRNRGVKKAPFIVLIGANMPSILAEISFISNPTDEKKLFTPEYRQKIADYLYKGIDRYVEGLSGLKVASHTVVTPVASKTAKAADPDR